MLNNFINRIVKLYLSRRFERIMQFKKDPAKFQHSWFIALKDKGQHTEFGRKYHFRKIKNYQEWSSIIPVHHYDDLKSDIQRMMMGEPDVLWPGVVKMFSKSSGTTQDKSKFIPVSKENFNKCHASGSWDSLAILYHNFPQARLFADKSLLMGGSHAPYPPHPKTMVGDISAIMIENLPWIARPFFTPDFETALLSDWEEKIAGMVKILKKEPRLTMIGGVPTWTIVLIKQLLQETGKDHLLELFPNLSVYMHGGVGFTPYKKQFQQYIPKPDFVYQEIYNASEGYFGVQDQFDKEEMLLLLDNGIFYEFIPKEEWNNENPKTISISDIEKDKDYSLVITTNGGLWRYIPGDTLRITSTQPVRFKVTGRMTQFINAFGEEVMITNTDKALEFTCAETNSIVSEYTVGPVYLNRNEKGAHQWLIEFEKVPPSVSEFAHKLDSHLQELNSDYQAKRFKSIALEPLKVHLLPRGTFLRWMESRGKLGGQYKVPRLANDRRYVDAIIDFMQVDSC